MGEPFQSFLSKQYWNDPLCTNHVFFQYGPMVQMPSSRKYALKNINKNDEGPMVQWSDSVFETGNELHKDKEKSVRGNGQSGLETIRSTLYKSCIFPLWSNGPNVQLKKICIEKYST